MKAAELEAKPQDCALRADIPTTQRLPMPEATQPVRIDWGYVCSLVGIHLLSLLIFVPWYFSWTGVVVAILGFPLYGLFGITLCYHRILTHRGLTIPTWLEHCFAILGVFSLP